MKRHFLIILSGSMVIPLGLGSCVNDLLFVVAPLLT